MTTVWNFLGDRFLESTKPAHPEPRMTTRSRSPLRASRALVENRRAADIVCGLNKAWNLGKARCVWPVERGTEIWRCGSVDRMGGMRFMRVVAQSQTWKFNCKC